MVNPVISKRRLLHKALVVMLALSELYYLFRSADGLLHIPGFSWIPTGAWPLLSAELLGRCAWSLLLFLFWKKVRDAAAAKDRRVIMFVLLTVVALALMTVVTLVCILSGWKIGVVMTAWIRASEIYLLLIWSLALLFLLISPFIRDLWKSCRLYVPALVGSFIYFILKGMAWLELVAGPFRIPFETVVPFWLILSILVFLGRLALLFLIVKEA